ncbi:hypothetical protein EIP91_009450 [Steccherinum ochraceum]|uniref:Uncharacterized protein n=1 Tax=Steccherinum ochraceum TaxID=92696 RepID=A0A4R0RJS5_9APHY|nr:hypothetical protein EIP91_009450 [Steccherinum ochraceum]
MSASEARTSTELQYTRSGESYGREHQAAAEPPHSAPLPEPKLPDLDLPQSELDLTMTFDSIFAEMAASKAAEQEHNKVQKRASNVLKLSQENETLKEQLRAMTERLEAAERKQRELEERKHATS